jgi:hypothetical protein
MYCQNCGTKNDGGVQYCANCGEKITSAEATTPTTEHQPTKKVFYSENWPRAKTMAIAVAPTYDLMADDDNFYVLKLPSSSAPVWGLFIGLIFLRLIGMVIGTAIGEAIAVSKRKSARNTWLDENHNLISSVYENYIFLKIPLAELKQHLSFEKGKFLVIKYSDGKITLRKTKKEYAIAEDYLKKYVLQ